MKSEKIVNRGKSFEVRLQKGNWWKHGEECLNMQDINEAPHYYTGTVKEWIEELTTYIDLYPATWRSIYEQYKALNKKESILNYYRDDEGYLRLVGLDVVYLKVAGAGELLPYSVLNRIGQMLSERAEEMFYSCQEYSQMDDGDKELWLENIKKDIQKSVGRENISVRLAGTLDESDFAGSELYFDLLNDSYIIL